MKHGFVEEIKNKYPQGTLIELINMKGEQNMMPGLRGTVDYVDDIGQIHMKWENGSALALVVNEDTFKVVKDNERKEN